MRCKLCVVVWVLLVAMPAGAQQGIITTVAGTAGGFSGGSVTNLGRIQGVAVDRSGNVFASDGGQDIVLKITAAGVVTIYAGNGISEFSGDGGPATKASLWTPSGVALDSAGNLYIADSNNHRIRKVDLGGRISAVAGSPQGQFEPRKDCHPGGWGRQRV